MPVDPTLAALLAEMPPLVNSEDPADAAIIRAAYSERMDPAVLDEFRSPVAEVRDRTVRAEGREIPVRIYRPGIDVPHNTLVFYHGGGWVIGDLETHDLACRQLCNELGATVLAVDYRLAPENPFPAGLDDTVAATRWALSHVDELGGDPARLAIGGDSAGGNFAAVVAQELRTERIAAQLLIYPATDSSKRYPSADAYADGYLLDSASMRLFESSYFVDPSMPTDPRVSPLLAVDLSGLPPAVVITAEFDPIGDQGNAYAEALAKAGNTVLHKQFPALTHGFVNFGPFVPAADDAIKQTIAMLQELLNAEGAA
ncbi:MAG: alpha/beta hydrolase [Sciscionella sp.]